MATFNNNAEKTLDVTVINKIREFGQSGGEPDIMRDLVKIFFCTTPSRLEKLTAAAANGDQKVLHLVAHSLKSSCAYLGAERMRSLCLELEKETKAGECDPEDIDVLVGKIKSEYAKVQPELANLLRA